MAVQDLIPQALGDSSSFNWTWFIELCVCGILVLFFFFYFNRLFATLVSYALRAYSWHAYRVWIDIQALQISFLGGRIFFKGVRYHGENETILVHSGFVTWRYWLRLVRQVDLTRYKEHHDHPSSGRSKEKTSEESSTESNAQDEEQGQVRRSIKGDARVAVSVTGVEWFIYNRTPMYDAIVQTVHADAQAPSLGSSSSSSAVPISEKTNNISIPKRRPTSNGTSSSDIPFTEKMEKRSSHMNDTMSQQSADNASIATEDLDQDASDVTLMQSLLVRFLPLYIECSRAAISLGNEHTKALIVTNVEKARGHVDASGCGPHDLFRQLFDFEIEHPVIQMRPNPDFRASQTATAESLISSTSKINQKRPWWKVELDLKHRKQKAIHVLRNLVPQFRSSVSSLQHNRHHDDIHLTYMPFRDTDPDSGPWHGLNRYLEDSESDDHQAWANIDYARFSTLLDCPAVHFTFYWDVPGRVKPEHLAAVELPFNGEINGVQAPGYGLDLTVKGGQINYGPWSDRLRAELQNVFLPAAYKSPLEAILLPVGAWRQSTVMIIRIDIEEEVTLRVPTKENSKDWRWRGRATAVRDAAALRKQRERRHFRFKRGPKGVPGPDIRPFGWLSVSVAPNSTVRYQMDMVARKSGFRNDLSLDLVDTRATSSVNHNLLWRCANQKVRADLSNPLTWNGPHCWQFHVENDAMELFMLRDHMFLLTDLISDFTAGQKADYMTFVPFRYNIGLQFKDLKLFLNANDYNIIDNPSDLDNNTFLVLGAQELRGQVDIPMEYFSAAQSSVLFKAEARDGYLDLNVPAWNTLRTFASHEKTATLKVLTLDGSYNYFATTTPQLTDSLIMDIVGKSLKLYLEGFLIRYFMNVKENYFGEDMHFRTFEEYQGAIGPNNQLVVEEKKSNLKKDNDLDVILTVRAEQSCALMPANIYDRSENLRVDVMSVEADMRFTNYYMDLQVNSSPAELSLETLMDDKSPQTTSCQLYIDTVTVYGHRLFGAPPDEPTYVCNWDFDIGTILGECSTQFIRILAAAMQSFVFTLDDDENALPIVRPNLIHDVTFLRARADLLRIWITSDEAGFLIELASLNLNLNDWARDHFSKHLEASIPNIMLAAIDLEVAHRQSESFVPTLACVQTSLEIAFIDKKADFKHNRELQQAHLKFHDMRTLRTEFLIRDNMELKLIPSGKTWSRDPPAMPVPDMPVPVANHESGSSKKQSFLLARADLSRSQSRQSANLPVAPVDAKDMDMSQQNVQNFDVSNEQASADYEMQTRDEDKIASIGAFSSPWMPPYFPLHKVIPDISSMPYADTSTQSLLGERRQTSYSDNDLPLTDEEALHAGIFVKLPTGIAAFCLPSLFKPVAALVTAIMAENVTSVFDDLQMRTISEVKSMTVERVRQVDDFSIYLPVAAVRLINPVAEQHMQSLLSDQYDLVIRDTRIMLRVTPTIAKQGQAGVKGNLLLTQATLGKIEVSVIENSLHRNQQANGMSASLEGAEFWLSLTESVRTNLQLGSIQLSSTDSSIERFSSLIDRSRRMVESIVKDLDALQSGSYARDLVFQLVSLDSMIADPVFLSRPSYVLRSAQDHVRQSDSWKFISILRQRLLTLMREAPDRMSGPNTLSSKVQTEAAHKIIMKFFNDLRTDETGSASTQPLLHALFGAETSGTNQSGNVTDIEAVVLLGQTVVTLDPGPRQSVFSLYSCDFTFAQKPDLEDKATNNGQVVNKRAKRAVQAWIARTAMDLNWEVMELIKSVATKIQSTTEETDITRQDTSNVDIDDTLQDDLTIVLGTDKASLRLTGINIDIEAGATCLKSSTVLRQTTQGMAVSLLISSTSTKLKFTNKQKILLHWHIRLPTIYGSYQKYPRRFSRSDTIHLAAKCDELGFEMREDVLCLLDVATAVIRDEASTIQDIVNISKGKSIATPAQPGRDSANVSPELHMALFLDKYSLRLVLLPTLHYLITGDVARTSITPRHKSKFAVHLDAKKSYHMLLKPDFSVRNSISKLEMPPVNGRVKLNISPNNVKIGVQTTIEKVVIDASAVQACFDALYRPENTRFVKSAKSAIDNLQDTIESTFATRKPSTSEAKAASPDQQLVLYNVNAVLAGVAVYCSTASMEAKDNRHAALKLVLSGMTLRVHNVREGFATSYEQPQFDFNLPKVNLGIYRQERDADCNVGMFTMGIKLSGVTEIDDTGAEIRNYHALSNGMQLDLYTETATVVVDAATFLQGRIAHLTTGEQRGTTRPLRRLTLAHIDRKAHKTVVTESDTASVSSSTFLSTTFALHLSRIQLRWILAEDTPVSPGRKPEDLILSVRTINLNTQREGSAQLTILDLQLQIVPKSQRDPVERSKNSALLPEMAFKAAHFSTKQDRRYAFQAAGKALDLRLAADGIVPLSAVQKSLSKSISELRALQGSAPTSLDPAQKTAPISMSANSTKPDTSIPSEPSLSPVKGLLGKKRLASLLVDADFAGAMLTVTPRVESQPNTAFGLFKGPKKSRTGRYGQAVQSGSAEDAVLRAPGIAMKVEYMDTGKTDPTLSTEVKVAGSKNTLAPTVVPLVLEIYSSIKEIIGENDSSDTKSDIIPPAQKYLATAADSSTDPTQIFGRVKLSAGLWIQRQEFSLTCQPVARVQANGKFDDIFFTLNTVEEEQQRFFSLILKFNNLEASVQHVYSRESTASFEVESIVMSLMNSKHVNDRNGISAILNVSPMRTNINAKQLQDFLLFREIWYPAEIRHASKPTVPAPTTSESQVYALQKYQELTATAALPWHAIVSVQELKVQVDFGQGLGKSSFTINRLWASSKKNSDWEQNLCIGFQRIGAESTGRMSGFVELQNLHARTSIRWPARNTSNTSAPLIQASLGFDHLRIKAAFDYQPFAVADVSSFDFLMYNVKQGKGTETDRLVGIVDGGKVQIFCISTAAGQVLAIVQAFERLMQEKRDAYNESLHELERLLRRKSIFPTSTYMANSTELEPKARPAKTSHQLHTDVVVTLKAVDIGCFPNTFFDNQILKIEAADAQARFAVATVGGKIRSGLGMSFGQVRVALSAVNRSNTKALGEVEISEVIERATSSRGGTIVKVPRLVASMQTWQEENSNLVEYIFRSTFQGKVDVGWNYSRISFIRGMWETHSQALAHRLGKPLPPSAVKITAAPQGSGAGGTGQETITAVVNMPQSSKFEYVPLEPPVIDTPQLRDMGEATPPLEWIGLHRDKLPNVTHSIVIVTLMEVAREVEDAYTRILGTG